MFAATEGNEPVAGALVGLALSWATRREGVYIPLGHAYLGCPPQIPIAALKSALGRCSRTPSSASAPADEKRDTIALAHHGIALAGVDFDLMLASYLLDPDLRGHGMHEILIRKYDLDAPDARAARAARARRGVSSGS